MEFHDGTPVTADAVAFSLKRTFDSSALAALPIESVSTPDKQTVTITTDGPFAPLPAHLTRGRIGIIAPSSVNSAGMLPNQSELVHSSSRLGSQGRASRRRRIRTITVLRPRSTAWSTKGSLIHRRAVLSSKTTNST